MPLKTYCKCGESTEYTLNKPIFCAACGSKFEGSTNIASQKPKFPKNTLHTEASNKVEEIEEDNIQETLDINVNALELDIPIDTRKEKGLTLGEVVQQQKTGFKRDKPKKVNKKKEFEAFLEASKNTRKPIEIEDSGPE